MNKLKLKKLTHNSLTIEIKTKSEYFKRITKKIIRINYLLSHNFE